MNKRDQCIYNPKIKLPVVEKVSIEIFALDIHPEITKENLDENIKILKTITE